MDIKEFEKKYAQIGDFSRPWIFISFIHPWDNKPHYFYNLVNKLSGDRLEAFDTNAPYVNPTKESTKLAISAIANKAKIIQRAGR